LIELASKNGSPQQDNPRKWPLCLNGLKDALCVIGAIGVSEMIACEYQKCIAPFFSDRQNQLF
jgi:hypothetical protein